MLVPHWNKICKNVMNILLYIIISPGIFYLYDQPEEWLFYVTSVFPISRAIVEHNEFFNVIIYYIMHV